MPEPAIFAPPGQPPRPGAVTKSAAALMAIMLTVPGHPQLSGNYCGDVVRPDINRRNTYRGHRRIVEAPAHSPFRRAPLAIALSDAALPLGANPQNSELLRDISTSVRNALCSSRAISSAQHPTVMKV